jgi:hypothetical protein
MISRYRTGRPGQISEATLGSLIRLHGPSSLRGRDPRVVGVFGVANLACDLGDRREGDGPTVFNPCLQDGARRHRVKAQGFPLPFRPLARLAQNEELGCTGREARSRGGLGKRAVTELERKLLVETDRRIAECKAHIAKQRDLIESAIQRGRSTEVAEETLEAIEASLRALERHRQRLLDRLKSASDDPKARNSQYVAGRTRSFGKKLSRCKYLYFRRSAASKTEHVA